MQLIYTIGIPGEPESNYVRETADADLQIENVIRGAWIRRYDINNFKPFMDPLEWDKVAQVMDVERAIDNKYHKGQKVYVQIFIETLSGTIDEVIGVSRDKGYEWIYLVTPDDHPHEKDATPRRGHLEQNIFLTRDEAGATAPRVIPGRIVKRGDESNS